MKKMFPLALVAAFAVPLFAATATEEAAPEKDELDLEEDLKAAVQVEEPRKNVAIWPAFIGVWEFPETPDLIGLRLTIPWSTKQENVTGFDVGFWGRCEYFEGFQCNILRNDVKDTCAGVQCGIYNSVTRGDLAGVQIGGWNESLAHRGVQFGIINVSGDTQGFQIGIINRSETMYGFQVGLINIIRDAEIQFMPVLNVGF